MKRLARTADYICLRTYSDIFDVNEAFATQWLSVQKVLELPNDKSNLFGGAIGASSLVRLSQSLLM